MKCPFLTGKYMFSCSARKEGYVPSARELEEFCTKSLHSMCPLFMSNDHGTAKPAKADEKKTPPSSVVNA